MKVVFISAAVVATANAQFGPGGTQQTTQPILGPGGTQKPILGPGGTRQPHPMKPIIPVPPPTPPPHPLGPGGIQPIPKPPTPVTPNYCSYYNVEKAGNDWCRHKKAKDGEDCAAQISKWALQQRGAWVSGCIITDATFYQAKDELRRKYFLPIVFSDKQVEGAFPNASKWERKQLKNSFNKMSEHGKKQVKTFLSYASKNTDNQMQIFSKFHELREYVVKNKNDLKIVTSIDNDFPALVGVDINTAEHALGKCASDPEVHHFQDDLNRWDLSNKKKTEVLKIFTDARKHNIQQEDPDLVKSEVLSALNVTNTTYVEDGEKLFEEYPGLLNVTYDCIQNNVTVTPPNNGHHHHHHH